jgi:uncharacterized protein YbaP (TraB family)
MVLDVRRLVTLWRAGDAEGLAAVLPSLDGLHAWPGRRLLTERNRDWVHTSSAACASAKAAWWWSGRRTWWGATGVVSLLQARGLTVRQHGVAASAPAAP